MVYADIQEKEQIERSEYMRHFTCQSVYSGFKYLINTLKFVFL